MGIVKREKLRDVAGSDPWVINNGLDSDRHPRPPTEIVKDARELVGKRLRYNLVEYNCEHFVKELRYGSAQSTQVQEVQNGGVSGALSGVIERKVTRFVLNIFRN
ncbi:phospholipase A and acyltransferase 3-like [Odontesthes bonariensis]|uniref:phospholipase A and acyltransferase 3-like n=1 Tax=Odontesthes bonariensis TaxID=219752 RepID=UPI003F5824CD